MTNIEPTPNGAAASETDWRASLALARERWEAERAQRHRDEEARRQFWVPTPLPVIPFFADLRQAVINGPIPPKRMPKWLWRLAPDLVLLLQPKDRTRVLFEGHVLEGAEITRASFTGSRASRRAGAAWWELKFWIEPAEEAWRVRPSGVGAPRGQYSQAGIERLRARVLAALSPEVFADVDAVALLVPQCLICGKALTDPVSQARWIGPECAGQSRSLPPSLEARVRAVRQGTLL